MEELNVNDPQPSSIRSSGIASKGETIATVHSETSNAAIQKKPKV